MLGDILKSLRIPWDGGDRWKGWLEARRSPVQGKGSPYKESGGRWMRCRHWDFLLITHGHCRKDINLSAQVMLGFFCKTWIRPSGVHFMIHPPYGTIISPQIWNQNEVLHLVLLSESFQAKPQLGNVITAMFEVRKMLMYFGRWELTVLSTSQNWEIAWTYLCARDFLSLKHKVLSKTDNYIFFILWNYLHKFTMGSHNVLGFVCFVPS